MTATIETNHVRIPCPDDRRVDLLGDDLAQLVDVLYERRVAANEALSELGRIQGELAKAEERDTKAYAAALEAGEPDPGPAHLNAATAAVAEGKRLAAGRESAATKASQSLHAALWAADRAPLVENLDQLAVAADARAREHLAAIETEMAEIRTLRSLNLYLDGFPQHRGSLVYDHQDAGRARTTIADQLDAMRPGAPLCR